MRKLRDIENGYYSVLFNPEIRINGMHLIHIYCQLLCYLHNGLLW